MKIDSKIVDNSWSMSIKRDFNFFKYLEYIKNKFSNEDMAFNFAGALTGALLSNYLNNNTSIFVTHSQEEKSTKINLAYNF